MYLFNIWMMIYKDTIKFLAQTGGKQVNRDLSTPLLFKQQLKFAQNQQKTAHVASYIVLMYDQKVNNQYNKNIAHAIYFVPRTLG